MLPSSWACGRADWGGGFLYGTLCRHSALNFSVDKSRKLGWLGFVDSNESFLEVFDDLAKLKMIPPVHKVKISFNGGIASKGALRAASRVGTTSRDHRVLVLAKHGSLHPAPESSVETVCARLCANFRACLSQLFYLAAVPNSSSHEPSGTCIIGSRPTSNWSRTCSPYRLHRDWST